MKFKKLKYYLLMNEVPQDKLAEALGITRNTLNRKINNRNNCGFTLKEAKEIKDFLKLDKNTFCELFEIFFE